MRSVALSDSSVVAASRQRAKEQQRQQDIDDFVFVHAAGDEDDGDDEASYDYCDDAYSLHSAPQSFALDCRALQSFQEHFFENPPPAAAAPNDEEAPLLSFEDVLNESSTDEVEILLEGLSSIVDEPPDPAVACRELLPSTAAERLLECPFASEHSTFRPGASDEKKSTLRASSHSYGGEVCPLQQPFPKIDAGSIMYSSTGVGSDDCDVSRIPSSDEKPHYDLTVSTDSNDSVTGSCRGSRKSNKKRRKQLKLARKAATAAAAAAAISQLTLSPTRRHQTATTLPPPVSTAATTATRNKKLQRRLKKSNKKQVANIAVACATESIAAYKEERLRKSKKV